MKKLMNAVRRRRGTAPSARRLVDIGAVVGVVSLLTVSNAYAGTGGTEFDGILTIVTDWMQGSLGKLIALAMIAVGIGAGVVRQTIMPVVYGLGAGLALFFAPTIIDTVMTATLPVV